MNFQNPMSGVKNDYVIKIEFQERGAPHAHCLLWVKNAPQIDVDTDEDVCSFVDEYISGRIPSSTDDLDNDDVCELVKRLEAHSHSAYCRQKGLCRFGFPKAPSPSMLISRQPEDDINAQEILKSSQEILAKVHEVLEGDQDITLEELLQKANVAEDQYTECLKVTQHGKKYNS